MRTIWTGQLTIDGRKPTPIDVEIVVDAAGKPHIRRFVTEGCASELSPNEVNATSLLAAIVDIATKNDPANFDPMRDVPTTDEQAHFALRWGRNRGTGEPLVGLYKVKRAQGAAVIDAYRYALKAQIAAFDAARAGREGSAK